MKARLRVAVCGLAGLLVSCTQEKRTMDRENITKAEGKVLFADTMGDNWQENWFLDGKKATVEHRDGGLYFAAGTVTKSEDPEEYHAHHAVLWTKQEFEGDLRITYEITRLDRGNYGTLLLYIQARGIGEPPYVEDIYAWRKLREVPIMSAYFNYMSLLHISYHHRLHARRYPADPAKGISLADTLLGEKQSNIDLAWGKPYKIVAEKKTPYLTFRILDGDTGQVLKEGTWDLSRNPENQEPRLIVKGRIGLRQMSTKQCLYRNFKVTQL